jgi:putative oxidoreductase
MLKRLTQTLDDAVFTRLRLFLAVLFLSHGAQKALGLFGGYAFVVTVRGLTPMGMPADPGLFVILTEFVGSLGLLLGAFTRIAGFAMTAFMSRALFMVRAPNGFPLNRFGQQKGEGLEYHLLAIALALRGAGSYSLDRIIAGGRTEASVVRGASSGLTARRARCRPPITNGPWCVQMPKTFVRQLCLPVL